MKGKKKKSEESIPANESDSAALRGISFLHFSLYIKKRKEEI